MRHYEIVLLIHPGQSEQVPSMIDRYKDMVTAKVGSAAAEAGRVHRVEDWGRRRLAYMINDFHKAHYVMFNVECGLETLRELEKNFKFNDSIVRSLVIRRRAAISEQSALASAKAEEDRIEAEKLAAQPASAGASSGDKKPKRESAAVVEDDEDAGGGEDAESLSTAEMKAADEPQAEAAGQPEIESDNPLKDSPEDQETA